MAETIARRMIMLSGGFSEFEAHRQIAIKAIKKPGYFAGSFEAGLLPQSNLSELAGRSAALICIFSFDQQFHHGSIPFGWELDEAYRHNLPVLIFIEHSTESPNVKLSRNEQHLQFENLLARYPRTRLYNVNGTAQFETAVNGAVAELIGRIEFGGSNLGFDRHSVDPLESSRPSEESGREETRTTTPAFEAPSVRSVSENFQTAPFYSDHAARTDLLNRKAVAETVATMIENVWRDADKEENIDRTFMVHLHGRWGSGKTSILNFLKESLLAQNSSGAANRSADPSWVVIDYNAWRNQALGPAWWTLMETVYRQARQQFGGWWTGNGQRLILRDRLWRLRSSYAPYALVAALLIVLGLLLIFIWKDSVVGKDKTWFDEGIKFIVSVVGLVATVFAFGHSYPIGSARTAKSYLELSRDPLNPLIKRYGDLVEDVGRPVAVFIDDLDRCNAAFVVELLQTIQTLFRNARVLYVVAADRDWVCASYQQIYKSFNETIGEPGKSLGHLFVEKVFQLSVEVPRLNELERNRYWDELIKSNLPAEPEIQQKLVEEATRAIQGAQTESAIIEIVDAYRNEPGVAQIVAAKAFRQMQAAPVEKERQHFLNKYAPLIEPNPRAMKRLLNAYGFRRGFDIQSRHRSDPDALVRWTILENRWPILADYLEGRIAGNAIIEALIKDKAVLEVANGLTWDKLRPVASAPDEPPKPETTPGTTKK